MIYLLISDPESDFSDLLGKFEDSLRIGPHEWLIEVEGAPTSKQFWAQLVADTEEDPDGIVFPVTGYYGLASPSVWEWIAAKRQSTAEP